MTWTTITIDATVGGASSNSFITLARANELIHARPNHDAWDSITDDEEKNAALVWATRILDAYKWLGYIASSDQALSFPRTGLYDNHGREFAGDAIPEWLEVATAELAFSVATDDRLTDNSIDGVSRVKIGSFEVQSATDISARVPSRVRTLFAPYLYASAKFNAGVRRV